MYEYPYFVIRHFAAFYERQRCFDLQKSREELIEDAVFLSRLENKKTCVVFGPDDAVYVEPEGKKESSGCLPRGGGS